MANVRKRGKKWYYKINWTDDQGVHRSAERVGGLTRKEAEQAWREAMTQVDATGIYLNNDLATFEECINTWLREYVDKRLKPNTQDSYHQIVRNHLLPAFGNQKIKYIRSLHIQQWIDEMSQKYSKSTVKIYRSVLVKFFNWAVLPGEFISSNPVIYTTLPKESIPKETTKVFTDDNIKSIFEQFPSTHRFHIPLLIAYYTGARLGEVLALRWDDIDFEDNLIRITATVYDRVGGFKRQDSPKTSHSYRTIKFGEALRAALIDHKTAQDSLIDTPYYEYTGYVCVNEQGMPLTSDALKYFGQWCRKTFGYGSFHSLRHTHATKLLEEGLSLDYVSKRLGHSTIATTANVYSSITDKRDNQAIDVINKKFATN